MYEKKARSFPISAGADFDILTLMCASDVDSEMNAALESQAELNEARTQLKRMLRQKQTLCSSKKEKHSIMTAQYLKKLQSRQLLEGIETSHFKKHRKEKELVIGIRLRELSCEIDTYNFLQQRIMMAQIGALEAEIKSIEEALVLLEKM